ncbi:MAG: Lacal_2735 family protein [Richelia sp. SM2_1_7]|nr:Lacal_2735 family protein [Richelia sp. SM2_1_7]
MIPIDKLEKQYKKLLEESHALSKTDRRASDQKMAEAEAVMAEIMKLKKD